MEYPLCDNHRPYKQGKNSVYSLWNKRKKLIRHFRQKNLDTKII